VNRFSNVICVCLCIVVSNTYCVVFLFCLSWLCVLCTQCCQFLCPFLIAPSVFSTVYFRTLGFYSSFLTVYCCNTMLDISTQLCTLQALFKLWLNVWLKISELRLNVCQPGSESWLHVFTYDLIFYTKILSYYCTESEQKHSVTILFTIACSTNHMT
jgi:hypothetical protein